MKPDVRTYQQILCSALPSLRQKYPIASLAIFGSYASGNATENSDIDVLVSFNGPIGIEFIDLADELEIITGKKVDLVSREGLKPRQIAYIEKNLQYVG
ncbi:MAG: nucleotidyltransferase family protein [Chitinophagaceae bacterium]